MNDLAIKIEVIGQIETLCQRVSDAIKPAGFGVLTRIDFDQKIKEKLGETLRPCIILGACHPKLAFEAYQQSSDAALLIPCNIVLTEIAGGKVRIEAMRPTQMLNILPGVQMGASVEKAEADLQAALATLK
jgi:uncharacterized protein (DUF302 family)